MSTDYTHFDKLAFNRLFGFGPDGTETLLINSSGIYVGPTSGISSTTALSVKSISTSSNATFAGIVKLGDGSAGSPALTFINDTDTGIFRGGSGILDFVSNGSTILAISPTTTQSSVPFQGPDGSAAAPTYSFSNDPDTGMYSGLTNKLFFSTGGSFALGINSTGQLQGNDGSVGVPTFSFVNEQNSGMYRVGAGSIAISVKGGKIASFNTTALLLTKVIQGAFGSLSSPAFSFVGAGSTGMYASTSALSLGFKGINVLIASTSTFVVAKAISASNLSGTNTGDNVNASTSTAGLVSTGAQSWAGIKTFKSRMELVGAFSNVGIGFYFSGANNELGLSGTDHYGMAIDYSFNSAVATATVRDFYAGPSSIANAGTTGLVMAYQAAPASKGAGSTWTRLVNYFSDVPTAGSNNAVIADNVAFSGNFFINAANTNPSVFAGSITASNVSGTNTGDNVNASTSTAGLVSTGAQSFAGSKTFKSATIHNIGGQNAVLINRYTNAGSGTGQVGLVVGNAGAAQGVGTFFYTNAAAAAQPNISITLTPRNNADTSNTDAVRLTLSKSSGNDGGEVLLQVSNTGGSLVNALTIDNATQFVIGTGTSAIHRLNTAVSTTASAGTVTLPIAAVGFISMSINGTTRKIPYYA